jgi:hypothetical protein
MFVGKADLKILGQAPRSSTSAYLFLCLLVTEKTLYVQNVSFINGVKHLWDNVSL